MSVFRPAPLQHILLLHDLPPDAVEVEALEGLIGLDEVQDCDYWSIAEINCLREVAYHLREEGST